MTNRTLSERLRDADRYSKIALEGLCLEAAIALDEAARVLEEIRGAVAEYAKIYRTKKVALGAYQACADVDKRARAALSNLKAAKEKDKSHG